MATPFQNFTTKLGIQSGRQPGTGFSSYAPNLLSSNNQATPGQQLFDKITARKTSGADIYSQNKQQVTNRLANDLANKSAGLKLDEFGRPDLTLTNFGELYQNQLQGVDQRGKNALATEEAKNAWNQANQMQNIGSYGFSGVAGANGSDVPGATSGNKGAQAVSIAMKAEKNGTPYAWGGNSLTRGVDCSGLVQQVYRQLGVSLPRTTYEQAKAGKQVSLSQIRPGDLVFYNNYGHVGIYMGNGKIIHSANKNLGIITSNLTNSNGAPLMVLRPY